MKTGVQTERLDSLLATLQHFDCSPDFGDSEAVAAIRKHLMVRIREAESVLRCTEQLEAKAPQSAPFSGEARVHSCAEAA